MDIFRLLGDFVGRLTMAADLNWIFISHTDQIEVKVSRNEDDSIIVTVNLRREITIDYYVVIFINNRLYERHNGIKEKINCNYTLSNIVLRGKITASLSVGEVEGEMSLPQEIPTSSSMFTESYYIASTTFY